MFSALSRRSATNLGGKVAFLTGASGALGEDVARRLHQRGVRLALAGRNTEKLEALADELGGKDSAIAVDMNVRNMASVEAAAKAAHDHFGALDIVIAGAGMVTTSKVLDYTATTFQDDIDTNLNGVWRTFRATLPYVQESRGHLVAIASLASFVALPGMSAYAASKAGVMSLCNSLRQELNGTGVTVGTINPTFFESALGDALTNDSVLGRATNNFAAPFQPIARGVVADAVVENIEKRSRTIVLPRSIHVAAFAQGAVQRALEPIVAHNMKKSATSH